MSTAEIKLDLINKITRLKETHIIEDIQNLLNFELEEGEFHVNDLQKVRLTEAQKDSIITEDEANNEIEVWLQER